MLAGRERLDCPSTDASAEGVLDGAGARKVKTAAFAPVKGVTYRRVGAALFGVRGRSEDACLDHGTVDDPEVHPVPPQVCGEGDAPSILRNDPITVRLGPSRLPFGLPNRQTHIVRGKTCVGGSLG